MYKTRSKRISLLLGIDDKTNMSYDEAKKRKEK